MTADTVGGVWTYAIDLARALRQERIEVALATLGRPCSTQQRRDAQDVASLGLFESSFRLPWMDQPWNDVRETRSWLKELSWYLEPDVLHLNDPVHASGDYNAPTVAVGHSCVLSWWQAVQKSPAPTSWNRYRREMLRGLASADAVVSPSQWMLQALRRYYGVQGGRVIPNGRFSTDLRPGTKEEFIFAAGRVWDPAKNLMALDEPAEDLAWPIYVAGEQHHPEGQSRVSASRIRMLGCLSATEIAEWLGRASIYAFPARYEPFGLSVLEAALSGCALVLSDIPTMRELWDGKAIFVGADDRAALQLAVEALIEDPQLRQTLAMRARQHALTLTPRRMALSYSAVYSELLTSSSAMPEEQACAS